MQYTRSAGALRCKAKIARCRSGITSSRRQGYRTSTNMTFQRAKLRIFSANRRRIFVAATILELRSDRPRRDDNIPDPVPDSVFVITAYELGPKAKRAIRRKKKKK